MYIIGPNSLPVSGLYATYGAYSLDNGASAAWTATAGSPTSATTAAFNWTPPSTAQTVRITAVSGGITAILDVVITDIFFAYRPSIAVEGTIDDVTILHEMENGARRGRRKVARKEKFELTFRSRLQAEYLAALALFDAVGKLRPFGMYHPITDLSSSWYIDSGVSVKYGGRGCSVDFSFRVKQV